MEGFGAAPGDGIEEDWEARLPASPALHLDGFDGPMDLLLDLAERQRIDLGRLSILALAEQFVAAMARFGDRVPIERRADWLVMATRLLLLRSRLLFPASPDGMRAAGREAAAALGRIDDLAEARRAAAWLGARPVLGEAVFGRGIPDRPRTHAEVENEADVIAFLWASLALFETDLAQVETVARYRPVWADLYSVTEARARILHLLGEGGDGATLGHFLPEVRAGDGAPPADPLRLPSAWASTFSAALELARQGDVALAQEAAFQAIAVRGRAPAPVM